MESLWRRQIETLTSKSEVPYSSSENTHRDVIVVGAGIAGLLIAYYLKEAGKSVLVLEADKIASGQTEKTTAKITSQHGMKYSSLIQKIGKERAGLYARANENAIAEYERLIRAKNIACDFERVPSYLYSKSCKKALMEEAEAAVSLGVDACFTREIQLPFAVEGAVCFKGQAQFSPLKFLAEIAKELEVWENTKVKAMGGGNVLAVSNKEVLLERTQLTADKIVLATHYPIRNVPGFYFLRQHQERSYVLALSGCEPIKGMYYSIDQGGLSLRQAGQLLLLGGGSHRTGKNQTGGAYEFLRGEARQYFPEGKEELHWSAQDCMPHDGIPFIGKYSVFTPNLYVATGFQKWGMTTAMIAAQILRDEICGRKNEYSRLFSPQRIHIRAAAGNLCTDLAESAMGLFGGWIKPGKKTRRCPHMGCELVWNPDEKSWDCPCHGSRFDEEGNLLDNPAKKGMMQ